MSINGKAYMAGIYNTSPKKSQAFIQSKTKGWAEAVRVSAAQLDRRASESFIVELKP